MTTFTPAHHRVGLASSAPAWSLLSAADMGPRESGTRDGHKRKAGGKRNSAAFHGSICTLLRCHQCQDPPQSLTTHPTPHRARVCYSCQQSTPLAQLFLAMAISGSWLVSLLNPILEIPASSSPPSHLLGQASTSRAPCVLLKG